MSNKERRFIVIHEEKPSRAELTRIIQDTVTGVCYLHVWAGTGTGLTPLLDAQGAPVVLPVDRT